MQATYHTVDGGAKQTGKSALFNTEGKHALVYWSVDWAGNTEAQHSVSVTIDKTASVQLTQQGATLNRATGKYVGGVTITNTSGASLTGPLKLRLSNLSNGPPLDNATGLDASGAPYVSLASPLAAGASVTVNLTFSNLNRVPVTYAAQLMRGDL